MNPLPKNGQQPKPLGGEGGGDKCILLVPNLRPIFWCRKSLNLSAQQEQVFLFVFYLLFFVSFFVCFCFLFHCLLVFFWWGGGSYDQVSPLYINVPRHEISNNVVCTTSKGSDQPVHTRRLIRAFASRLNIL